MKIVFISNYFNHHQAPLSDALHRQTQGNLLFVETASMPRERRVLGYPQLRRDYVRAWETAEEEIRQAVREADAILAGEAPEELIRWCIRQDKLVFRYSERPLRNGPEPLKYLPRLLRWHWRNPPGRPIFLLSAGEQAAEDYRRYALFRNRAFQWGYFPEFLEQSADKLLSCKNPKQILWCGRFLELKHPELAMEAADRLHREGYAFTLTFLGAGEQEEKLKDLAAQKGLTGCVRFPGAASPAQVRSVMAQAGIFLFTSDRREGWGVVVNEAMNSGCAVIASHSPGAVSSLLVSGENGLVFPAGDADALREQLRYLLDHPQEQRRLGLAAYETLRSRWNPETAARRLIALTRTLLDGGDGNALFREGPCAPVRKRKKEWIP